MVACSRCRGCCRFVSCGIALPSLHDDPARLEAYPDHKRCRAHGLTGFIARRQAGGLLLRLKLPWRTGSLYQTGCGRPADPFDLRWRRQHDAGFFAGRQHNCFSIKPGWRRHLFEIPAFGGEARLLARDGLNPRFSPDGSQVAYWIGAKEFPRQYPEAARSGWSLQPEGNRGELG